MSIASAKVESDVLVELRCGLRSPVFRLVNIGVDASMLVLRVCFVAATTTIMFLG